jgi:hypothetical protein
MLCSMQQVTMINAECRVMYKWEEWELACDISMDLYES